MKLSAIATIALGAASTIAAPVAESKEFVTPEGNKVRGLGNQGDGFYLAEFDKNGVAEIKFTPMAHLNTTVGETSGVERRWGPDGQFCLYDFPGNGGDLDTANVALANNAQAHGWYNGPNAWGWVHYNSATAFFCAYTGHYISYSNVIDWDTQVSNKCGGNFRYGYVHYNELTIGRTFNGDTFCAAGFRG